MGLNGNDRDELQEALAREGGLLDEIDAPHLTRLAGLCMTLCRRRHRMHKGDPGAKEDYDAAKEQIAQILVGNE